MALCRRLCRPQTGDKDDDDDDDKAAKLFVLLDCAQCQWKVTFTWLQRIDELGNESSLSAPLTTGPRCALFVAREDSCFLLEA